MRKNYIISVKNELEMTKLGKAIASLLEGGECIELIGDIGAGKTYLTRVIAKSLGTTDPVQSPTFTISRIYELGNNLQMHHYDFYRLDDPGLMSYELEQSLNDKGVITVIEWSETVAAVLPDTRLSININTMSEHGRKVRFEAADKMISKLEKALR